MIKYDAKINFGHIVSVVTVLVACTTAWAIRGSDVDNIKIKVEHVAAKVDAQDRKIVELEIINAKILAECQYLREKIDKIDQAQSKILTSLQR